MLFQKEPGKVGEKAIRAFKEIDDNYFYDLTQYKEISFYCLSLSNN